MSWTHSLLMRNHHSSAPHHAGPPVRGPKVVCINIPWAKINPVYWDYSAATNRTPPPGAFQLRTWTHAFFIHWPSGPPQGPRQSMPIHHCSSSLKHNVNSLHASSVALQPTCIIVPVTQRSVLVSIDHREPPVMMKAEFEEVMSRNRTVSSSAIFGLCPMQRLVRNTYALFPSAVIRYVIINICLGGLLAVSSPAPLKRW